MKKKTLLFILTPFIIILLFILFVYIAFSKPDPEYLGDETKCNSIPGAKISCEKAYELALPHLDKSFALKNRNQNGEPSDYISQLNDWYYINRDFPVGKSNWFYAGGDTAVKINKETGEIIEPK